MLCSDDHEVWKWRYAISKQGDIGCKDYDLGYKARFGSVACRDL